MTGLLADLEFDRESSKDLLVVIDEECDRMDHLVEKASKVARLESGQIKLLPKPHSIGELISTSLAENMNAGSWWRKTRKGCQHAFRKVQVSVRFRQAAPSLQSLTPTASTSPEQNKKSTGSLSLSNFR